MKWINLLSFLLFTFISFSSLAQSETHDMITYDTIYRESSASNTQRWALRITRPRNMFTANHVDTASRPVIIMMQGQGEAGSSATDTTNMKNKAKTYGPHYWLDHGWDGGITLANGKHYPILITVVPSYVNPRGPAFTALINHILNTYHIKRNAVHGTGLSMGAFTWTKCIAYEASAGAETFMKSITSICALEGAKNETYAPYDAWSLGWAAFGHWAHKYGGKFLGLEGSNDGRQVWKVSQPMNDSVPGSAYFSFEKIGGGAHCCWNSMYDPSATDWRSIPTITNTAVITTKTDAPNTIGTYQNNNSLFQWMLRQGDTTLVGGTPPSNIDPTADAGPDRLIFSPQDTVHITGSGADSDGTIVSYNWSKILGGSATITPNNTASMVLSQLTPGDYTFRLTVTDDDGATATNDMNITVQDTTTIPPGDGVAKRININIYNPGLNSGGYYGDSTWNNWNVAGTIAITHLIYEDGDTSSIAVSQPAVATVSDNGASYGGGVWPATPLRHTIYGAGTKNFTISGLSSAKHYNIKLVGSRSNPSSFAKYTINGHTITFVTYNNKDSAAVFNDISPMGDSIVFTLQNGSTYYYLNIIVIEEVGSLPAPNVDPTADAGPNRVIYYPQDTAHITGLGSDSDGTIASYSWSKLSGDTAVITPNNTAGTVLSQLVPGNYSFRLTVTDNDGATAADDMEVTVLDTSLRRININIYNPGLNSGGYYGDSTWNNWNVVGTTAITHLIYEDGDTSSIAVSQPATATVSDNGASYGGGVWPATPLRHTIYGAGTKNFTISGLASNKHYNIKLVGSRSNPSSFAKYTINGHTITFVTYNNKDSAAVFNNISPTGDSIVFTLQNGSTYYYLNIIVIEEIGSDATGLDVAKGTILATTSTPLINTSVSNEINLAPNPANAGVLLTSKNKMQRIELYNSAGLLVKKIICDDSTKEFINLTNLREGIYSCRVFAAKSVRTVKLAVSH